MAIDNTQLAGTPQNQLMVPFADQYVGVWSILERHANALLQQAQQINIQLHLEQAATPERQAAIAAQASTELSVTREGVAVIQLSGSLTKQASSFASSRSTVAARRQVRAAAADESVTGILLYIDSPGGMVAGTADLADEITTAKKKKPVYAYIEDLGASAAYWIASQADKVFANSSAEVGSIGVFMVVTDWKAFAEKEGAKVHVVRFGDYKGAGVAGTEITDAQLAEWQRSVDNYGAMFVDAIAAGRGLTKTQAQQLADGRIHPAAAAADLKLIDGVQSLDATMAALVVAGNGQKQKGKKMSTTASTDAPAREPATAAQLKAEFPESSAEFRMEQLEKGATIAEAHKAYSAHLTEQLKKEQAAREEAEKKAADAEKARSATSSANTKPANQVRGNKLATTSGEGASEGQVDYYQMAKEYQAKHKCRWSEACLEIKRRHPESRSVFGAPPKEDR